MNLPDCPHRGCDANQTLEAVESEGRGVKVCVCNCCGKTCRVNADGEVIWPVVRDPKADVWGNQIDGP